MKHLPQYLLNLAIVLGLPLRAASTVHYVDINSTNATPPYTNWATAATIIQDAVDAAVNGDEVVVTDGSYNPVNVSTRLSLRSLNGPGATAIRGRSGRVNARCVYLSGGASLSGFTLSGGTADDGGGAYGGTLTNCTLRANAAFYGGGGAAHCTLEACWLENNSVNSGLFGGLSVGGGAYNCTLHNCVLSGNGANSLVAGPYAYGGGAYSCTLNNCTLVGNSAYGGGAESECTLNNCIQFANTPDSDWSSPGQQVGDNWIGDPLFVDYAGGNLRLQSNSPCINAGLNAYAPAGPDLDGNPRIVGGTVDIGAYEYQSLSLISFNVISNEAAFDITGQSNQIVTVETSPDLVNWSPLATNTLNGHPFPFSDPTPATLPQRFYRAQVQ